MPTILLHYEVPARTTSTSRHYQGPCCAQGALHDSDDARKARSSTDAGHKPEVPAELSADLQGSQQRTFSLSVLS